MTPTEIARVANVSRQAVVDARARNTPAWRNRYSRIALGHPDPGPTRSTSPATALAARAGLSIRALAAAMGISARAIDRAANGESPAILAQINAFIAAQKATP